MQGLFITFEGLEGSGKTTQTKKLKRFFENQNREIVLTREPGGTSLGQEIRKILLSKTEETFPPIAELLLYESDRNIHLHNVIKPALENGKVVVCDRFYDSSLAYQGYARKLDRNLIKNLNELATEGLKPDITFFLDIPVELSQMRVGKNKDRIESEDYSFHQKLREGFLEIAKENKGRFVVINGNQSKTKVFEEIVKYLQNIDYMQQ